MKLKILFILLFLNMRVLFPQENVFVCFQPVDSGLGIRLDFQAWDKSFYGSLSYGNGGLYKLTGLSAHKKLSFGYRLPFKDKRGYLFQITGGLNYHTLKIEGDCSQGLNPILRRPFSFELGTSLEINKFIIGVRTDILRWEPSIDFGRKLKF